MDRRFLHRLSGNKQGAWEIGLVRCVGVVLRFEAECVVRSVACRPGSAAKMISRVELHPWLRRFDFQRSS